MKFKPNPVILSPIDLSESSPDVIATATALAKANEGKIIFVYVAIPELPASSGAAIAPVEEVVQQEREKFEHVRPTDPTVPSEHIFRRGDPADEILDVARETGCDLIVMGTHGRTGLKRVLMGSVAEKVVRNAECPVLTIRTRNHHPLPA